MTDPSNWQPPAGQASAEPRYGELRPPGAPVPPPGGPGFGAGWAPPPKPGLIPLRPLSFGSLLWAPFQVLKRNPKATFGSALIVQALVTLVTLVTVGLVTFFAVSRIAGASVEERDAVAAGSTVTIVLSAIVPLALSVVASALLQGVIVIEVSRATLGEKLRLRALWRSARGRLLPLVGWTVLLGAAFLVAFALVGGLVVVLVTLGQEWVPLAVVIGILGGLGLIVLSAWLGTRTSLTPSLIVLERLPIRSAALRSWSLTRGYFWRTLGVQYLVALMLSIITQIVTTPLSLLFGLATSLVDPNDSLDAYVPAVILYVVILFVSLVLGAMAAVVQSATTALIYIDLRMRKEGLDLELARYVEARSAGHDIADPYSTAAAADTVRAHSAAEGSPSA